MEYDISKIDAAVDQIDWSIRLFLDYQAYVLAITLAGAAEEILGQTLSGDSSFNLLKRRISARLNLLENVASQLHLNKARKLVKTLA